MIQFSAAFVRSRFTWPSYGQRSQAFCRCLFIHWPGFFFATRSVLVFCSTAHFQICFFSRAELIDQCTECLNLLPNPRLTLLTEWLEETPTLQLHGVALHDYGDMGIGLKATKKLEPKDTILLIPMDLVFRY